VGAFKFFGQGFSTPTSAKVSSFFVFQMRVALGTRAIGSFAKTILVLVGHTLHAHN
jgi:hypothetical protein